MPDVTDGNGGTYKPPQRGLASAKQLSRQWDATQQLGSLRHGQTFDRTPLPPFWAVVTLATRDGPNFRWTYTIVEAVKSPGFGGWQAVEGGLTGNAYNTFEDMNATTGMLGIGVTVESLAASNFAIVPVPIGEPVLAYTVPVGGNDFEYTFSAPNGEDGECTPTDTGEGDGGTP